MDEDLLVARLRADLAGAALFVDFDGSVAPIVAQPPDARPLPAAVDALARLAPRCRRVAVLSGRPVAFLDPWFPPAICLAGLYGLERRDAGGLASHPDATPWRQVVATLANQARRELPAGVLVEDKGLSLTLHFRTAPDAEPFVVRFADEQARATGLHARAAKMSVELHPPLAIDKGTVIEEWAEGASTVLYAGDDAGDLPAFAALRRLASPVVTVGIAVAGAETPPVVLAAADLVVAGPPGLADLLQRLASS